MVETYRESYSICKCFSNIIFSTRYALANHEYAFRETVSFIRRSPENLLTGMSGISALAFVSIIVRSLTSLINTSNSFPNLQRAIHSTYDSCLKGMGNWQNVQACRLETLFILALFLFAVLLGVITFYFIIIMGSVWLVILLLPVIIFVARSIFSIFTYFLSIFLMKNVARFLKNENFEGWVSITSLLLLALGFHLDLLYLD
jgi:hypothetical protein